MKSCKRTQGHRELNSESVKSKPYYVYELVVRNSSKGASPLLVAANMQPYHSIGHFLQAFQTNLIKIYGNNTNRRPIMIFCDGSMTLLNSVPLTSLEDLLQKYFQILIGQHPTDTFNLSILHRCLRNIMKNVRDLCMKQYVYFEEEYYIIHSKIQLIIELQNTSLLCTYLGSLHVLQV